MTQSRRGLAALAIASVVCGVLVPVVTAAQSQTAAGAAAPAVTRTILLRQDMSLAGREALMVLVELPPGSAEGRHTHNAEAYVFVEEGSITLEHEGQPTRTLKAGEVFHVPSGHVHEAKNTTGAPARLSAVFVAEKGQPLTVPVP